MAPVTDQALTDRHCVPCKEGTPPLGPGEIEGLVVMLEGWEPVEGHHLAKTYSYPDFVSALAFVNRLGGGCGCCLCRCRDGGCDHRGGNDRWTFLRNAHFTFVQFAWCTLELDF